ncbi:hypothetical protein PsW64_00455 [Pseudovibrio sp. W64]|nr:hypothetical protein PsAD46_04868 [Pseudovibrio sp. Ad46]KZK80468.1 hypothetical protein PsAD13_04530 [Pseudovibrio sp. Ad13]KZK89539.1 hypothetical protein PsAD5_04823 [Pseudovibrio sp. Ad5]KZK89829.1 hypothetical protein PsW64_00455 [Pseudovibrio sp. W64]KZK97564.1 hypothetical protein PsW74_03700 [Pseudovibrio sp. W74]KZK99098.1 hypothetical protein PsAD26_04906 [Pseudovibrio sp. Ad26]KZL04732.1 hypothetical protein PsAD14_04969 [Pseudovibrio sp. Ad14]
MPFFMALLEKHLGSLKISVANNMCKAGGYFLVVL